MIQIRTIFNAKPQPTFETVGTRRHTIPDQTMSIRQILARYVKGQPIDQVEREPIYYGEEELPQLERMDLADRQAYREALQEHISSLENQLKHERDAENQKHATGGFGQPGEQTGPGEQSPGPVLA